VEEKVDAAKGSEKSRLALLSFFALPVFLFCTLGRSCAHSIHHILVSW